MSKKDLKIGELLQAAGVSTVDTDQEQIEYIPLDLIDRDPDNFYSLEGLEELAANIETVGLQQPIRVRSGEGRRVVIVSGHRRHAACLLIRDGGSHMFDRGVPCIRERGDVSREMQELRLIFANSSTRVLSGAEISKQAEKVEALFVALEQQGVKFPGSMREKVAAAVNASQSRVARLHAIRGRLIDDLIGFFDAGHLNESVAYRLSQETTQTQIEIVKLLGPAVTSLTKESADAVIAQIKSPKSYAGKCAEQEKTDCHTSATALACNDGAAVPENESGDANKTIDGLNRYLEGRAEEDRQFLKLLELAADSLIRHSFASGALPIRRDSIDILRLDLRNSGSNDLDTDWMGDNKGLTIRKCRTAEKYFATWTEVYDALAAIAITRWRRVLVDERAGRRGRRPLQDDAPAWRTGTPEKEGWYSCWAVLKEPPGNWDPDYETFWWNGKFWSQHEHARVDCGCEVLGWFKLPEEMEADDV